MHFNQVAKWRRRYLSGGLGALQDEPRSGRKDNLSPKVLRQIVDQATRPPQGRERSQERFKDRGSTPLASKLFIIMYLHKLDRLT